ncbi:MAG: periplasmic heavy metal sensor [Pseudomonadota bacterium]
MKKLLTTTILALTIGFSSLACANSDWYGKEGQEEKSYYMNNAISKLPNNKAADFRKNLSESDEDNKQLRQQLYQLHSDLHAILVAPEFDKDSFHIKRGEIQRVYDKMESNRTEAFANAVSELSQEERVILTRSLHNSHKAKHYKKHAQKKHVETEYNQKNTDSIEH